MELRLETDGALALGQTDLGDHQGVVGGNAELGDSLDQVRAQFVHRVDETLVQARVISTADLDIVG